MNFNYLTMIVYRKLLVVVGRRIGSYGWLIFISLVAGGNKINSPWYNLEVVFGFFRKIKRKL